jgi:hypothetical protein
VAATEEEATGRGACPGGRPRWRRLVRRPGLAVVEATVVGLGRGRQRKWGVRVRVKEMWEFIYERVR